MFGENPLRDAAKNLDKLKRLGVDIIWLSPVNQSDDIGMISYSVTDYFKIRSDYGTEADLKYFVNQAHARNIKVILDFVPNHTSAVHPFLLSAQELGEKSPYYDFYDRDENGDTTYYFDWEHLLNLNYSNIKVQNLMVDAFKYWIKEFDVDGYRIDVAWGIQERAPQFWKRAITEIRKIKPNAIMLAEGTAQNPQFIASGFDLAYDWTDQLGVWAWKNAFDDFSNVGSHLKKYFANTDNLKTSTIRFINNNDTGERFISRFGPRVTKVAATLLHTIPGVPIIYNGDEIGAEFQPYDDPPAFMWNDPHRLTPFYEKLTTLRESYPALTDGSLELINTGSPQSLVFRRSLSEQELVVVFNFGSKTTVTLPAPAKSINRSSGRGTRIYDLITDKDVSYQSLPNGNILLQVPATTSLILINQ